MRRPVARRARAHRRGGPKSEGAESVKFLRPGGFGPVVSRLDPVRKRGEDLYLHVKLFVSLPPTRSSQLGCGTGRPRSTCMLPTTA